MQSILIIKASSLGDIIHCFPCLEVLHERFPQAKIDWVVEQPFAELVRAHPLVNRTLCIQTKKWRTGFFSKTNFVEIKEFRKTLREVSYDIVFDLQGNLKSGLVASQAKSRVKVGFGRQTVAEWPNLLFSSHKYDPPSGSNIRDDYLFLVQSYLQDFSPWEPKKLQLGILPDQKQEIDTILHAPCLNNRAKVLVCPGANWRNKQLTEETLLDFLEKIEKHCSASFLFAWGNDQERTLAQKLHTRFTQESLLLPKLPLPALQNLMTQVDLVIAMDSLPLHLAGSTETPSFSVFGPSSAAKFKPKGAHHHAFQGACPYGKTFAKRCPILRTCATGSCIRELSGNVLFDDFQTWYSHKS